jgi:ABC-type glycerol-3-phosphate transport system permease component
LSIVASYGLSTMRKWSIFLTTVVSLSGIAFGCTTAYAIYRMFNLGLTEIALLTAMLSYVALLIVSILWMALNKDKFR